MFVPSVEHMRSERRAQDQFTAPASCGAAVAGKCAPDADDLVDYHSHQGEVPCFASGSQIATVRGVVAVEDLCQGDMVLTRDNGIRPIAWIGRRPLCADELALRPQHRPIRIAAGALGRGLPDRDLIVSPNHRVLIHSPALRAMVGEGEALVPAEQLVGAPGITQDDVTSVSYFHVMFDRHEVILSNGAWTESLHPQLKTLSGFSEAQREEIFALFPELRFWRGLRAYDSARRMVDMSTPDLLRAVREDMTR